MISISLFGKIYRSVYFCDSMNKAAKTRQHIIESVAPVFNKQGYVGTALSDIEVATGLSKGAIYGNFGNKDELARACFKHNLKPLQRGLMRSLASPGSSVDKLKALTRFYREHFELVASRGGCPLMNTSIEADDTLPFLKVLVQQRIDSWQQELSNLVKLGQAEGSIAPDADEKQFSISAIALIEGGILLAKAMDDASYFSRVMDQLDELIDKELKIDK